MAACRVIAVLTVLTAAAATSLSAEAALEAAAGHKANGGINGTNVTKGANGTNGTNHSSNHTIRFAEETEQEALTIEGQWWFDRLRGIAHKYAGTLGPLSIQGEYLVALPESKYVLVLACSPWWHHCRIAASEFDRFAQGLHEAGIEEHLQALTLDCSWRSNLAVCSRLLGPPRPQPAMWQDGVNAPKILEPAYLEESDLWPELAFPKLVLALRRDLMDQRPVEVRQSLRKDERMSSFVPNKPLTAEMILDWLAIARVEAIGSPIPGTVKLLTRADFGSLMTRQELRAPGSHSTVQGCICKSSWRHCGSSLWGFLRRQVSECRTVHGCPVGVGFCQTTWPCGETHEPTDKCDPDRLSSEERPERHSNEIDIKAALALWLHDIFTRHPFEPLELDPGQVRRKMLIQFLQLLCSYFPENLEGRMPEAVRRDHLHPDKSKGCRASLCHLGGLLADDADWMDLTEEIEVSMNRLPEEVEDPVTGAFGHEAKKPPARFLKRGKMRRILWRKLEIKWKLCGKPWPEYAQMGFDACRTVEPGHSGLSCGVWQLLHALTAAAAQEHECKWAPVHDQNRCVGPATNQTANDIHKMEKKLSKEVFAEQWLVAAKMNHNSTVPEHFHMGQPDLHATHCFKVKAQATDPEAPPERRVLQNCLNHNATMWLRLENSTEQGYQGLSTHKIYATLLDLDDSLGNKLDPSLAGQALYLDFTEDYVRNDGGAIVNQLLSGPEELRFIQFETWKLVTVEGVSTSGHDWYEMLAGALRGQEVVLRGPVPCNHSNPLELCDQPCADFLFDSNTAKEVQREWWLKEDWGSLKEVSTQWCLGEIWTQEALWFQRRNLGVGLQACEGDGPQWGVQKHHFFRNESWCSEWNRTLCLNVFKTLKLPHRRWVSVDPKQEVHASELPPAALIGRIRAMVALFWRCKECRKNFLRLEFNEAEMQKPRDAVIWLWNAHNAITSEIFLEAGEYIVEQDPDAKQELVLSRERGREALWPSQSLCPRCRRNTTSKADLGQSKKYPSLDSAFDLDEVYRFLINGFYVSHEKGLKKQVVWEAYRANGTLGGAATGGGGGNEQKVLGVHGQMVEVTQEQNILSRSAVLGAAVAGAERLSGEPERAARRVSLLASGAFVASLAAALVWAAVLRPASRCDATLGLSGRGPASSAGPEAGAALLGIGPESQFRYTRALG